MKKLRPKHNMEDFKIYEVECVCCTLMWNLEKRPDTEVWCPLCECDEPCKVKEIT